MKIGEKSKFIFIMTSNGILEDRFLHDVGHGIEVLKSKGVSGNDIMVVSSASPLILIIKCPHFTGVNFVEPSQLFNTIEQTECENLFIISSCHGSINGIDSTHPIKPYALTQAIKNNPFVKNALIFLGQCYAGIFNHMDVRHEDKNIVYIGATDINTSLSCRVNGFSWTANISVLALFCWLDKPFDVDGDGILSVTDMYKFVSYSTNNIINDIEKTKNTQLIASMMQYEKHAQQAQAKNPQALKLVQDAQMLIQNYFVPHQSTWLLNALSASKMYFE